MSGEPIILGVLATGSDKSSSFLVPAKWEHSATTIVVAPLISLIIDHQKRSDEAGITNSMYRSHRPPPFDSKIVFVTPETAVSTSFWTYLRSLATRNRLDRIIFDEAHTLMDSSELSREPLLEIHYLFAFESQMVLLTATLPPSEEPTLFDLLRIPHQDGVVTIIRAKHTIRANLRYQVRELGGEPICHLIQGVVNGWADRKGKTIIYAASIQEVEKLAQKLGYLSFHSQKQHDSKKQTIDQFALESNSHAIVATNALGLGIDIPDVHCVIHTHIPATLRDYVQESGRAARRSTQTGEAIIVKDATHHATKSNPLLQQRSSGHVAMEKYINTTTCRRKVLDSYMDRQDRDDECDGEVEQLCDNCHLAHNDMDLADDDDVLAEIATTEISRLQQEEQEELRMWNERRDRVRRVHDYRSNIAREAYEVKLKIPQLVNIASDKCIVCYALNPTKLESHTTMSCPNIPDNVANSILKVKRQIRYAPYSCCFRCGLPQQFCDSYDTTPAGGFRSIRPCQTRPIVIILVVALAELNVKGLGDSLRKTLRDSHLPDEMWSLNTMAWYGQKLRWHNIESTKMFQIFMHFGQEVQLV